MDKYTQPYTVLFDSKLIQPVFNFGNHFMCITINDYS